MSRSRVDLAGAHAIVTGGSAGIGLAVGERLARKGARVSLIARDPERLVAAAARVAGAATASADVTDPVALRAAIDGLVAERGPCDVLVTSAGSAHPGYFLELDEAVFRSQMELDYFGTLHAIRAVLPSMVERRRGTVVGISSDAGLIGVFGYTAYGATKFAVRGLLDALRAEMRPYGVHVLCAYPPDTDTPGFEAENLLKPPETAAISAGIKLRSADEVAASIVDGIERSRVVITTDVQSALLARVAGLLRPVLDRVMDRAADRVR